MAEVTKNSKSRGVRTEVVGRVVSGKMAKTISVQVFRLVKHAKYGKYIKRSSVFMADDSKSEARVGDQVRLVETRPLSKSKRWKLVEVVEKAPVQEVLHDSNAE